MSTFVFIHGGLHGAWCWQRILGPLRDAGHHVDAIDLPSVSGTAGPDFGAEIEAIASAVSRAQPPVVLVSHSLGGAKVGQYLEGAPDSVAGLVLVNALLVEDGEAVLAKFETAGDESVFTQPGALIFSDDGTAFSMTGETALNGFYNQCRPEDAAWAAAQLHPEPLAPLLVPLRISDSGFGAVPKIYLGSRHDRALPWWMQEQMTKASGVPLIEHSGDHSPFLSVPDELVGQLLNLAEKWSQP